jgi:hypothetical protein
MTLSGSPVTMELHALKGQRLAWRRSSWCEHAACLEFAMSGDYVYLRDSKEADTGEVLMFGRLQFNAFLNGIKSHEFEDQG